jgi:hypothetical protein
MTDRSVKDIKWYAYKHPKEMRAIADLVTDEVDEPIAAMTVRQLTEAIDIANCMLWDLMYWVDDYGNVHRIKNRKIE